MIRSKGMCHSHLHWQPGDVFKSAWLALHDINNIRHTNEDWKPIPQMSPIQIFSCGCGSCTKSLWAAHQQKLFNYFQKFNKLKKMTMIFMQTGIFTFNCIYEINTVNVCTLTSVIISYESMKGARQTHSEAQNAKTIKLKNKFRIKKFRNK